MGNAAVLHVQTNYSEAVAGLAALEAEQSLLGLLMYSAGCFDDVRHVVRTEHFTEGFHGRLYGEIARLLAADRPALAEVLAPLFANDPAFHDLGGYTYLWNLIDHAPHASVAGDLAQEIAGIHVRRSIVALGHDAVNAARDLSTPSDAVLSGIEQAAAELATVGVNKAHWLNGGAVIADALASAEARAGRIEYTLGLAELDQMTGGAHAGELTLLAGRPGMAKTTVVGRIALANAAAGKASLVYSLEMAAEPMGLRLGCDTAYDRYGARSFTDPETWGNPTVSGAMMNRLSREQRRLLREAARTVGDLPLQIDVRSGLTLSQIEAGARRAFREWKRKGVEPGPVVIDHLGKVRPEKDRAGSRHAEVADISGGLAELAKRLGVPVIACAQLNRAVEGRGDDKRPVLSDLRQAGELEEDARQVVFLYRPEYYYRPPENPEAETSERRFDRERKLDQVRHKLFFLVEKNSHGPTGQVEAFCDIACSAVRDRLEP